ncbi:MAG: 1-deoxy-D-xylulose-5-phosphate reductoisomerase [Chitinivibrionales bacterium]|nr:1-deoxy-D-xylulose-5-phosphate reductoisomerase [Chitinivibrionales bacterium]
MKILLLGSTGSIGASACRCIERFKERFTLVGLAANRSLATLHAQIRVFAPAAVCIGDEALAQTAKNDLPSSVKLYRGRAGMEALVNELDYDLLVNALVGEVGLRSTVAALMRNKRVALANKESLVIGGDYINALLGRGLGSIVPIDSEHSAIMQCLRGEDPATIESIILTASGGPFRNLPQERLAAMTPEEALKHPTWVMGKKVTIDAATLLNKGLELIEAHHLFNLPYDKLRVLIHPQSIIHSLVEFHDGALMAQLGVPSMELPIQFALGFPERLPDASRRLSLSEIGTLTFFEPDHARFPCLELCREAGKAGGSIPVVLNAANEVAVALFLNHKIAFTAIARIIEDALDRARPAPADSLDAIEQIDRDTRASVLKTYHHG